MSATFVDAGEMVSRQCLRGEAYSVRYVEPLNDARTKLAAFFSLLLGRNFWLQLLFGSVTGWFEGIAAHALDLD